MAEPGVAGVSERFAHESFRPKVVVRWGATVMCALSTVAALSGEGVGGLLLMAACAVWVWRVRIERQYDVLVPHLRPGGRPLDLTRLRRIVLRREGSFGSWRVQYRAIALYSDDAVLTFRLIFWDWPPLLRAIADHAVRLDASGDPEWQIEVEGDLDVLLYQVGWC